MINEEKVKSMTKAAAYENSTEKKNIEISDYYRTDYLGLQMVKSAIAYVAAFCIVMALWTVSGGEELMLKLSQGEYLQRLLKVVVILFAAGLLVYEIAVYVYYSWRYECAKESVGEFHAHLKKIHKFYETQESAEDDGVVIELSDEENAL